MRKMFSFDDVIMQDIPCESQVISSSTWDKLGVWDTWDFIEKPGTLGYLCQQLMVRRLALQVFGNMPRGAQWSAKAKQGLL